MKPILLHGHERAITQIKYNREGDLLFSCAKDTEPNVWFSLNGERLGTFQGHEGAVWCIDVDWTSTNVVTGAADNMFKLWDCETGCCLRTLNTDTAVRACGFSYSGNLVFLSTDKAMGYPSQLRVYDKRDENQIVKDAPFMNIDCKDNKITSAVWGPLDDCIVTGHVDGSVNKWDVKTEEHVSSVREHTDQINDMQLNKDSTMLITASRDNRARLFDLESLELMKTFTTDRPVNSAAISPLFDHVVLGGGQDAMNVTQTSARIGKFDARFFDLVFEEEFGRVKDHFGPINSVAFHPDGKSYSSGGEDGYVRVHVFDRTYFDFKLDF